jgi:hypothetical protein
MPVSSAFFVHFVNKQWKSPLFFSKIPLYYKKGKKYEIICE